MHHHTPTATAQDPARWASARAHAAELGWAGRIDADLSVVADRLARITRRWNPPDGPAGSNLDYLQGKAAELSLAAGRLHDGLAQAWAAAEGRPLDRGRVRRVRDLQHATRQVVHALRFDHAPDELAFVLANLQTAVAAIERDDHTDAGDRT